MVSGYIFTSRKRWKDDCYLAPTKSMACRNSLNPNFWLLSSSNTLNHMTKWSFYRRKKILLLFLYLKTRFAVATPLFKSGNKLVNWVWVRPSEKSFLNPSYISSISAALCLVCWDSHNMSDSGSLIRCRVKTENI